MGSSVNNESTNGGHEEVAFKSKDIPSKTKAGQKKEYFVKFKEKTTGQKLSEGLDKNKDKVLAILCIVIGAVVLIAVIVVIIILVNRPTPEQTREERLNEIATEAENLLEQTKYTAASNNIEEYVNAAETNEEKAAIYTRFALVTFETYGMGNAANEILDYLYKAEAVNPSAESAANIAVLERIRGNTSYADIYEKEVVKRDPNYDIEDSVFYSDRKDETNEPQE